MMFFAALHQLTLAEHGHLRARRHHVRKLLRRRRVRSRSYHRLRLQLGVQAGGLP